MITEIQEQIKDLHKFISALVRWRTFWSKLQDVPYDNLESPFAMVCQFEEMPHNGCIWWCITVILTETSTIDNDVERNCR